MKQYVTGWRPVATALMLLQAAPALAETEQGILTVSGSAMMQVEPDLATMTFGVEAQGSTAAAALAANSEAMAAIIDAIRAEGLADDEISTAQFDISPVYERRQEGPNGPYTQVLSGYRVNNLLNVETGQLETVAAVIDAAVAAGANRVDRVGFGLTREVQDRSRKALIEGAVRNAQERADLALAPLDYEITGIKNMSVSEYAPPSPVFAEGARAAAAMSAAPPMMAGDQVVSTTVNVTFLIGPK